MWPFLHLLSLILVLPSVLLASAFIILGRAIASRSLPGLLWQLLNDVLWMVPWGVLGAGTIILLIAIGGFVGRTRRMAGIAVAVLGIGSIVIGLTLIISHSNFTWDQLPFFIPAAIGSSIGLWPAFAKRRDPSAPDGA